MEFIIHKVNTIKELKNIPEKFGCEIDIRTDGSNLILNHDPLKKGESFIDYLDEYNNGTLVLNIKESGIEDMVLEEVKKRNINSFFLLDVEFPYLYKAIKMKEKNIAVRFSEMEPIENVMLFKNKVNWVWIDTIYNYPVNEKNAEILKYFKTCLVCPSRWSNKSQISQIKKEISDSKFKIDSVMTELKFIKKWV